MDSPKRCKRATITSACVHHHSPGSVRRSRGSPHPLPPGRALPASPTATPGASPLSGASPPPPPLFPTTSRSACFPLSCLLCPPVAISLPLSYRPCLVRDSSHLRRLGEDKSSKQTSNAATSLSLSSSPLCYDFSLPWSSIHPPPPPLPSPFTTPSVPPPSASCAGSRRPRGMPMSPHPHNPLELCESLALQCRSGRGAVICFLVLSPGCSWHLRISVWKGPAFVSCTLPRGPSCRWPYLVEPRSHPFNIVQQAVDVCHHRLKHCICGLGAQRLRKETPPCLQAELFRPGKRSPFARLAAEPIKKPQSVFFIRRALRTPLPLLPSPLPVSHSTERLTGRTSDRSQLSNVSSSMVPMTTCSCSKTIWRLPVESCTRFHKDRRQQTRARKRQDAC